MNSISFTVTGMGEGTQRYVHIKSNEQSIDCRFPCKKHTKIQLQCPIRLNKIQVHFSMGQAVVAHHYHIASLGDVFRAG